MICHIAAIQGDTEGAGIDTIRQVTAGYAEGIGGGAIVGLAVIFVNLSTG
jgi:hypothetical protein